MIVMLLMRVLLITICLETSARYWIWWMKVRARNDVGILPPLLIGVAVAQAGIAVRQTGVFYPYVHEPLLGIVLLADILMLIGTILHLVPCWRISHSFSERRMAIEIALRGIMAVALASLIFLFSLTRYFM
jgi:hypothetical protein